MSAKELTVILENDVATIIEKRIASGAYPSEAAVIADGLRALDERDREVDTWLKTDVVAAYDAHRAHTENARPFNEAAAAIRARMGRLAGR